MSMSKVMSNDRAAEKLAQVLLNYHSGKGWEKELADVLQAFAVKYHELSPEVHVGTDSDDHPSTLWHKFFVKSLQNMLKELPINVDKLKEALDALDGEYASRKRRHMDNDEADGKQASRKRRRTENDEAVEVDIPKGKRAMIRHVSKLKVYIAGSYTIHAPKGQAEVIELTLGDPSIIDVKFWFPPGRVSAIPDSHDF